MQQNFSTAIRDDKPIVRQVVYNVLPLVRSRLDSALIREFQSQCLHYHLTFWPPLPSDEAGSSTPGRTGKSIEQTWEEHLLTAKIPADIKRDDLKELGLNLLKEVNDAPTATEA